MISRTVVPVDVRPPSPDQVRQIKKGARRTTTYMDERTVVPPELSENAVPLDGKSSIPEHLPLGVLVDRTLVPRGMPAKPIERSENGDGHHSIAVLDERMVVPAYIEPPDEKELTESPKAPTLTPELREVIEPDIFITGDPNLLVAADPKRDVKADSIVRVMSIIIHIALVIFLISIPKLFPYHAPSQADLERTNEAMNWIYHAPRMSTPAPVVPKVHIPRAVLKQLAPVEKSPYVAPAEPQPTPVKPEAAKPAPELPAAPTPQIPVHQQQPQSIPAPSQLEAVKPNIPKPSQRFNFNIPSANQSLSDQLQHAIQNRGEQPTYRMPDDRGGLPRGQGAPGSGPGMQGGVSILTPTNGVDFNPYLNRLVAIVRRNWFAVMPESALMGDRGVVSITFHINRDGSMPGIDPLMERTSGKEPLDAAAMSAIRTSSPFEPLPQEFKGPDIQLRFVFFYNLPVDFSH
ncbi:MAG TPA: TonB family protein [Candidatus Acidoferrum sp.]|nr:TonB family protein [Candidatus Acidoferrum sp.]